MVVLVLGVGVGAFVSRGGDADPAEPTRARPTPDPSKSDSVSDSDRAFHDDSWWNTPLPDDPPLHPHGDGILDYLSTAPENGDGCLWLAGVGKTPWGQPIYESQPSDPQYDVAGERRWHLPELERLRIPRGALPADNSDGSMTVYDRARGYVVAMTGAEYDQVADRWSATGATVTYLDSNGLHVATGRSDDPRNRGTHRGNNGAVMAVERDDVDAGAVRNVLKVALGPETSNRYVFPMVGSDGDYTGSDPRVPPQGLRLRIKPSVDLERMGLRPEALVIARALQEYGFYIGDSGGRTSLKLENTYVQGAGVRWHLPADELCDLRFTSDYWEVLAEGYDPSAAGPRKRPTGGP